MNQSTPSRTRVESTSDLLAPAASECRWCGTDIVPIIGGSFGGWTHVESDSICCPPRVAEPAP